MTTATKSARSRKPTTDASATDAPLKVIGDGPASDTPSLLGGRPASEGEGGGEWEDMPRTIAAIPAVTYKPAGDDVTDGLRGLVADHYPDLAAVGLRVRPLFAWHKDGDRAVKHHGYPAAAVIRKTSYKQRCQGATDAELVIDGQHWARLADRQRLALLDHELNHLEVMRDKKHPSMYRVDPLGRPVLKIRRHDYEIGVFRLMAERWGRDALDVQLVAEVAGDREFKQLVMDWSDDR